MKANELRIGNYVYDNLGGVLKIKGISLDSTLSHIKQIPLTEEWLFKFGFSKPEWTVGGFSRTEKGNVILLDMRLRAGGSIRIDYVHQLQNLYFALTGEELTIGGQDE